MPERQGKPFRGGLSRRQLFVSSGAAAGGLAFAASASGDDPAVAPQEPSGDVIGGVITALVGVSSFEIERADQAGPLSVELLPAAELVRDGPVALSDFVVGDEVAVRGEFSATGSFSASSLQAFYRVVAAEVADRQGDTLQTSAGDLQLSS